MAAVKMATVENMLAFAVDNDSEGHSKLLKHIKTRKNPLVVFEATGGYERGLCEFLREETIPLTMVNPARVRDFARSEGVRAKTDPIDTKMILAFAKSKALCAMETPSETFTKLAALLDRRGHLVEQLAREKNRLQNSEKLILRSIQRMIKILEKEISALDKAIDQQRQPRGMRNLGDARDVEHIESRVTQGFGEEHSGIGPDRLAPGRQIARINEGRIDTETPQRVIEQVVRPTVERATREHVRTGAREGRDRQMQCRLATGRGDCTHAPIEGRNAFFEHGRGRIGDA